METRELPPDARLSAIFQQAQDVAKSSVDSGIPVLRFYRSSEELVRRTQLYEKEKNFKAAYFLALKTAMIFTSEIKKHRQYNTLTDHQRTTLQQRATQAVVVAERVKPAIKQQVQIEFNRDKNSRTNQERYYPYEVLTIHAELSPEPDQPCLQPVPAKKPLPNDYLYNVTKRPADFQGQLNRALQSHEDPRPQQKAIYPDAKRQFILSEIAKPAFLDNGRARGSTHRRQDMTDVQMRMIHGESWTWTCDRLKRRFNELERRYDDAQEEKAPKPDSEILDEKTLATIIQMVVKEASNQKRPKHE